MTQEYYYELHFFGLEVRWLTNENTKVRFSGNPKGS
jgi:hypothetical protein